MAYQELGSQVGDSKKTRTLKQYLAEHGRPGGGQSCVKVVFKPNKYGGYSLVCDHGFRVEVREDNALHGVLSDSLEDWAEDGTSLWVKVLDVEKAEWSLCLSTDDIADWEEKPWGYMLSLRPPTPKKAPRQPHTPKKPREESVPAT